MKIISTLIALVLSLLLCSGCKVGWCAMAVPKSMGQINGKVEAIRTDAQGQEISRLELRYKDRTWQFVYSPEGPAERDYEIWRRLYEVTGGEAVRIPFLSTREEYSGIFYWDYFPVGQESWVGVKGVGTGAFLDLSMMVFTKEKITSKFLIPAVLQRKIMRNYDFVDPWKLDEQNEQLLRIDTLNNGTVVFDLQTGEFVTGQNLVTEVDLNRK